MPLVDIFTSMIELVAVALGTVAAGRSSVVLPLSQLFAAGVDCVFPVARRSQGPLGVFQMDVPGVFANSSVSAPGPGWIGPQV